MQSVSKARHALGRQSRGTIFISVRNSIRCRGRELHLRGLLIRMRYGRDRKSQSGMVDLIRGKLGVRVRTGLRADMDAVPIMECIGKPLKISGIASCRHDGHMRIFVALPLRARPSARPSIALGSLVYLAGDEPACDLRWLAAPWRRAAIRR